MTTSHTQNAERTQIGILSELLTPQQVVNFLKKAIPELKLSQASLRQSLENQQWGTATKQAHRLKSTISLLSADSLVSNLDLIESGHDSNIRSPEFRELVVDQCQQLVDTLEQYLSKH